MNLDLNWYGSYDECYSDDTALEKFGLLHNTQTPVKGQYCNMNLNLPLPAEIRGVCFISTEKALLAFLIVLIV